MNGDAKKCTERTDYDIGHNLCVLDRKASVGGRGAQCNLCIGGWLVHVPPDGNKSVIQLEGYDNGIFWKA